MNNRTVDDIASAISAIDAAIAIVRTEAGYAATHHDIDMLRFAQTVLRDIVARNATTHDIDTAIAAIDAAMAIIGVVRAKALR